MLPLKSLPVESYRRPEEPYCRPEPEFTEGWFDCVADWPADCAPAVVEATSACRYAGVRDVRAATGTTAIDTGELETVGATAAPFTGLPWPGIIVIMATAVTAARPRSVIAPVIIPVRKLTSSSRALMVARIPSPEPVIR